MKPFRPRKSRYTEPSADNYIYNGLDKKVCTKCKRPLPAHPDFFQRQHANGSYYYRGECRSCGAKVDKKRNADNPRGGER